MPDNYIVNNPLINHKYKLIYFQYSKQDVIVLV